MDPQGYILYGYYILYGALRAFYGELSALYRLFYGQETLLQTIFITFIVGCGCAWQTGRSMAMTWRPLAAVIRAMILLGFAVRFLHFALFEEDLFVPLAYLFETACLIVTASLAWRYTRARQMVRQYYWLYEPAGPLSWRQRQNSPAKGA